MHRARRRSRAAQRSLCRVVLSPILWRAVARGREFAFRRCRLRRPSVLCLVWQMRQWPVCARHRITPTPESRIVSSDYWPAILEPRMDASCQHAWVGVNSNSFQPRNHVIRPFGQFKRLRQLSSVTHRRAFPDHAPPGSGMTRHVLSGARGGHKRRPEPHGQHEIVHLVCRGSENKRVRLVRGEGHGVSD